MSATPTTVLASLKEEWSDDKLVPQIYEGGPFLANVERTEKFNVGDKVIGAITEHRTGGISVVPTAGSSALNPAGNVGMRQFQYDLVTDIVQVKAELGAILKTGGKAQAVAEVLDTEVESAVQEARKHKTRQIFSDQTALIAKCGTTNGSNEVELDPAQGYAALVRDWLHVSMTVDIGTTSVEDDIAAGVRIEAVEISESTPSITISGSTVSTDSDDYVSIANARDGTTSYESNGLRNIIGSGALGGLSGGRWAAAAVDTSTTSLTLQALNDMHRKIRMQVGGQRGESAGYKVYMSYLQHQRFDDEQRVQLRFGGETAIDAKGFEFTKYNGMEIYSEPDIRDSDVFFVNMKDLFLAVGNGAGFGASGWLQNPGGGASLKWQEGTTAFADAFYYTGNLCARRRSRMGAFTALT